MRLKSLVFSSLLMSTAFVACTNEEILDVQSQPNMKEAIALGEGFTIEGAVNNALSRAAFAELEGGIKAVWEPNDIVGAAWFYALTNEPTKADLSDATGFGFSNKFSSNHPFDRVDKTGNVASAKFQTVTNMFAGKYVLYYPFDETLAQVEGEIPVSVETAQTMDVANPLAHISKKENIFFYSNQHYALGGNQAGTFAINAVPVLYRVRFAADEATRGIVGKTISMIVVEAETTEGSAFYKNGKIVANNASSYKEAKAEYEGADPLSVFTLTLAGNEDDANYQISSIEATGATKKPFFFSMLPANSDIQSLKFKVVTTEGEVYSATISGLQNTEKEEVMESMTTEGGYFNNVITLKEVEEATDDIYTVQQFNAAWEDALKKSGSTISLGAPISLETLTLDKTNANITIEGSPLTVGELTLTDGTLSVQHLVAENVTVSEYGILSAFEKENETQTLEVSGLINVSGEAYLKGVNKLNQVTVRRRAIFSLEGAAGDATKTVEGAFTTNTGSIVSLKNITLKSTTSLNGNVNVAGTVKFAGATTLTGQGTYLNAANDANATVEFKSSATVGEGTTISNRGMSAVTFEGSLTNNGSINIDAEGMVFKGATENNGIMTVSEAVTNEGTFTDKAGIRIAGNENFSNEGTMTINAKAVKVTTEATGKIENAEGKTLTVKAADKADESENDVTELMDINNAGNMEVVLSSSTSTVTFDDLNNTGVLTITKGKVVESASEAVSGTGEVKIAANGGLNLFDADSDGIQGYIVITKAGQVELIPTPEESQDSEETSINADLKIAADAAYYKSAMTEVKFIIFSANTTIDNTKLEALGTKSWVLRADLTFADATDEDGEVDEVADEYEFANGFIVEGERTIKSDLDGAKLIISGKSASINVTSPALLKVDAKMELNLSNLTDVDASRIIMMGTNNLVLPTPSEEGDI